MSILALTDIIDNLDRPPVYPSVEFPNPRDQIPRMFWSVEDGGSMVIVPPENQLKKAGLSLRAIDMTLDSFDGRRRCSFSGADGPSRRLAIRFVVESKNRDLPAVIVLLPNDGSCLWKDIRDEALSFWGLDPSPRFLLFRQGIPMDLEYALMERAMWDESQHHFVEVWFPPYRLSGFQCYPATCVL